MQARKRHPFVFLLNFLIFALAVFFHPAEGFIAIKTATPMLILPLLCAFSVFNSVYACVVAGFLTGVCFDAITSKSFCFNTIVFILLAVAVNLCANNLFNKNIRSVSLLSVLSAVFYFTLKWIIFFAIGANIADSLLYLLKYALPSAIYSAIFIFPFFFIYRKFEKILTSH